MVEERILALDVSSKTGYALLISGQEGIIPEAYGIIPQIHEPEGQFPANYIDWAYKIFSEIVKLIDDLRPDVLVVEQTSAGSKSIFSQKILEWVHWLLAKCIVDNGLKVVYMMTEEWRRVVGCVMSKEEKLRNKKVRDYKKKNKTKLARDTNGKIMGKVGRKHVNVRVANQTFSKYFPEPLRQKDEDLADALLLGAAYHLRRIKK